MRISLIAAVAEDGAIGRDGGMPWHLSGDLRRFRATTTGRPVVMGRKTYESIGRPLPGRANIVVTRSRDFAPDGVEVAHDLEAALDRAAALAEAAGVDEVFVIGGGVLYAAALPRAGRIYLTEVHADIEGDVHFPALDPAEWREISRERHPAGARDDHPHSFVVLDRIAASPAA
ncbi:MAG: dihydrofolate reductase [Rhodospirillaceae bacterium]